MCGVEILAYTLIKKLKKLILPVLIKFGFIKIRCQRGRILTEEKANEFRETYNQIPENMLEFLGEFSIETNYRKYKNSTWKNWFEYFTRFDPTKLSRL